MLQSAKHAKDDKVSLHVDCTCKLWALVDGQRINCFLGFVSQTQIPDMIVGRVLNRSAYLQMPMPVVLRLSCTKSKHSQRRVPANAGVCTATKLCICISYYMSDFRLSWYPLLFDGWRVLMHCQIDWQDYNRNVIMCLCCMSEYPHLDDIWKAERFT